MFIVDFHISAMFCYVVVAHVRFVLFRSGLFVCLVLLHCSVMRCYVMLCHVMFSVVYRCVGVFVLCVLYSDVSLCVVLDCIVRGLVCVPVIYVCCVVCGVVVFVCALCVS